MKKRFAVLFLFVVLSSSVLAYGDARNNNAQTLSSTVINGHAIELKHVNLVGSEDICADLGGFFPVFFSRQKQVIFIDGVEYSSPGADSEWFDQWDNWEHCPRLNDPGKNRENCVNVLSEFYQEGNELKINVWNHGGDCDPDTCNNCANPWDVIESLSVPYPFAGECVPGSACCTPQGTFSDATAVCNIGLQENAGCSIGSCNAGAKYRYGTQYCSGSSADCNGAIEWSEYGVCSEPPNIFPEVCNQLDDNCNILVDEGPGLVVGSVCSVDNSTCYDGTPLNTCSVTKPYYCESFTGIFYAGRLIQDSQTCGCPEGLQPLSWGGCGLSLPPPIIMNFWTEIAPNVVSLGQSVTFRVFVEDTSPLLSVQAYYIQYPLDVNPSTISQNPLDYTTPLPVAFHPVGTVSVCDTCTGLADVYEGVLSQGFINQGLYSFRIKVIDQANQVDDRVIFDQVMVILPLTGEACTVLQESGDPSSKMNVFFLNDVDNVASQNVYNDITLMTKDRMRGIPPIPENNLQDKFNFYRNDLAIDIDCVPACDSLQQISAALLCNKPVKISDNIDSFSDKIVTFTTDTSSASGTAGYFVTVHYRLLFGFPNTYWSDVILHELGHTFGFLHTHNYVNFSGNYTYLGCDSPRDTIMCYASPHIYTYSTPLQLRNNCLQRNDIPPGFPAPAYNFCYDQYSSNTEYLIGELSKIP